MTIKGNGGIFGRNPTFNNVTVDGTLTVDQIVEKTGAAGITLDGVTLKDGNVVLAAGKGIDFSATSGTGTSELFDDYEEGTFTPAITFGGASVGVTYSGRIGYYTKIGNLVNVSLYFQLSNKGSSSGNAEITGLPFTSNNDLYNLAAGSLSMNAITFAVIPAGIIVQNSSKISLRELTNAGVFSFLTNVDFANNSNMLITLSYRA